MPFFSRDKRIISIDPSGKSIKVAQVKNRGTKRAPIIEAFFYEKLSGQGQLKEFLAKIQPKLDTKRSQVVLVIHGIQSIYRLLDLPRMGEVELEKAIRYEEEVYVPFPPEERVVDFKVLEERDTETLVALAGVRRSAIEELVAPFLDAGFGLTSAELAGLCLVNLFNFMKLEDPSSTVVLLDVGANFTEFVVVSQGIPFVIREINIGGDLFTEHLEDVLHLNAEEAELIKCNPGEREAEVKSALEPIFYRFAEEIKVSMEYTGHQSLGKVSKIFVSGGGSRTPGLREYLEKSVGVPVLSWSALEKFEVAKGVDKNSLEFRQDMIHACLGATVL